MDKKKPKSKGSKVSLKHKLFSGKPAKEEEARVVGRRLSIDAANYLLNNMKSDTTNILGSMSNLKQVKSSDGTIILETVNKPAKTRDTTKTANTLNIEAVGNKHAVSYSNSKTTNRGASSMSISRKTNSKYALGNKVHELIERHEEMTTGHTSKPLVNPALSVLNDFVRPGELHNISIYSSDEESDYASDITDETPSLDSPVAPKAPPSPRPVQPCKSYDLLVDNDKLVINIIPNNEIPEPKRQQSVTSVGYDHRYHRCCIRRARDKLGCLLLGDRVDGDKKHWGKVVKEEDTNLARNYESVPWCPADGEQKPRKPGQYEDYGPEDGSIGDRICNCLCDWIICAFVARN